jgi:hypothetical protein
MKVAIPEKELQSCLAIVRPSCKSVFKVAYDIICVVFVFLPSLPAVMFHVPC